MTNASAKPSYFMDKTDILIDNLLFKFAASAPGKLRLPYQAAGAALCCAKRRTRRYCGKLRVSPVRITRILLLSLA